MEGTVGEIRMFAGNFPPRGWAYCNGQMIAIQSNTALYTILGTTYGGDGKTTFGLPNLAGRTVIGAGERPGLTRRDLGQLGGAAQVNLDQTTMPSHVHGVLLNGKMNVSSAIGDVATPTNGVSLARAQYSVGQTNIPIVRFSSETGDVVVNKTPQSGANFTPIVTGKNIPHNNIQPSIGMHFIICLSGEYPVRN